MLWTFPYASHLRKSCNFPLVVLLLLFLFSSGCHSYTEVFSIAKDSDDTTYFAGNRDSNFFISKKNSLCSLQWESTAGSTSGDDDNDQNSEILYDVIVGGDGLIYAVGSTRGNFSSPADEVPNLDAALVVYDPATGEVVRQKQYDVAADLDNVAPAIAQMASGTLLVAVYGSISNVQSSAIYETRILEIDANSLSILNLHTVDVTTTESFSVTGGPRIVDFIYEESSNSIVAVGHILGRGILWRYSLTTGATTDQVEWGNAFGNFQISGFTVDSSGRFYIVGSSSENVLSNSDLQTTVSSEFHAYVIRYDDLSDSPAWVRQLGGTGSSQSGSGISFDPITGDLVVVGDFDADFSVTDAQTGTSFSVRAITNNGLTDVFLWYLNPDSGDFVDLRESTTASTTSEDKGNALAILTSRIVAVGGIVNDGDDSRSTVCDETRLVPSPSPTPSVSVSPTVTPSPTASVSSTTTPTPRASASSTVTPTLSPSQASAPSLSGTPALSPSITSSSSTSVSFSPLATPSVSASSSAVIPATPAQALSTTPSPSAFTSSVAISPSALVVVLQSATPSSSSEVSASTSVTPSTSDRSSSSDGSAAPTIQASVVLVSPSASLTTSAVFEDVTQDTPEAEESVAVSTIEISEEATTEAIPDPLDATSEAEVQTGTPSPSPSSVLNLETIVSTSAATPSASPADSSTFLTPSPDLSQEVSTVSASPAATGTPFSASLGSTTPSSSSAASPAAVVFASATPSSSSAASPIAVVLASATPSSSSAASPIAVVLASATPSSSSILSAVILDTPSPSVLPTVSETPQETQEEKGTDSFAPESPADSDSMLAFETATEEPSEVAFSPSVTSSSALATDVFTSQPPSQAPDATETASDELSGTDSPLVELGETSDEELDEDEGRGTHVVMTPSQETSSTPDVAETASSVAFSSATPSASPAETASITEGPAVSSPLASEDIAEETTFSSPFTDDADDAKNFLSASPVSPRVSDDFPSSTDSAHEMLDLEGGPQEDQTVWSTSPVVSDVEASPLVSPIEASDTGNGLVGTPEEAIFVTVSPSKAAATVVFVSATPSTFPVPSTILIVLSSATPSRSLAPASTPPSAAASPSVTVIDEPESSSLSASPAGIGMSEEPQSQVSPNFIDQASAEPTIVSSTPETVSGPNAEAQATVPVLDELRTGEASETMEAESSPELFSMTFPSPSSSLDFALESSEDDPLNSLRPDGSRSPSASATSGSTEPRGTLEASPERSTEVLPSSSPNSPQTREEESSPEVSDVPLKDIVMSPDASIEVTRTNSIRPTPSDSEAPTASPSSIGPQLPSVPTASIQASFIPLPSPSELLEILQRPSPSIQQLQEQTPSLSFEASSPDPEQTSGVFEDVLPTPEIASSVLPSQLDDNFPISSAGALPDDSPPSLPLREDPSPDAILGRDDEPQSTEEVPTKISSKPSKTASASPQTSVLPESAPREDSNRSQDPQVSSSGIPLPPLQSIKASESSSILNEASISARPQGLTSSVPSASPSIPQASKLPVAQSQVPAFSPTSRPQEPQNSFIDIILSSATPSSSANIVAMSPSSSAIATHSPTISQPSGNGTSANPSSAGIPSDAVVIVLPSPTPSSSSKGRERVEPTLPAIDGLPELLISPEPSQLLDDMPTETASPTPQRTERGAAPSETPTHSQSPTVNSIPPSPSFTQAPQTSRSSPVPSPTVSEPTSSIATDILSASPSATDGFRPLPVVSEDAFPSPSAIVSLTPSALPVQTGRAAASASQSVVPPTKTPEATFSASPSPSVSQRTSDFPLPSPPRSARPTPSLVPTSSTETEPSPSRGPPRGNIGESPDGSEFPEPSAFPSAEFRATRTPRVTASPFQSESLSITEPPGVSAEGTPTPIVTLTVSASLSLAPSQSIGPILETSVEVTQGPLFTETPEFADTPEPSDEAALEAPSLLPETSLGATVTPSPIQSSFVTPSRSPQLLPSSTAAASISASPSTDTVPTVECLNDGTVVADRSSLEKTNNFQRVNMVIQIAGPNLTNSCELTTRIADRFIRLSATNTLSQPDMWYITSLEDGPAVLAGGSTLVTIEEIGNPGFGNVQGSPSATPSAGSDNRVLFSGSVIFNVTAFMDPLSVVLASGAYVEYVDSQNIVKVMTSKGFDDIKWTGMVIPPEVLDARVSQEEAVARNTGVVSSGGIAAIAVGTLLILGIAGFVVMEGSLSASRSAVVLPV